MDHSVLSRFKFKFSLLITSDWILNATDIHDEILAIVRLFGFDHFGGGCRIHNGPDESRKWSIIARYQSFNHWLFLVFSPNFCEFFPFFFSSIFLPVKKIYKKLKFYWYFRKRTEAKERNDRDRRKWILTRKYLSFELLIVACLVRSGTWIRSTFNFRSKCFLSAQSGPAVFGIIN